MPFFMLMKGQLFQHQFAYLENYQGRRLDDTISPKTPKPNKADESVSTWVHDIMTKKVQTLEIDDPIEKAIEIFKTKGFHHIPVSNKKRLVGIVTDRDLAWLDRIDLTKSALVKDSMNEIVVVAHQDTPLDHLAHVFYREEINGMPIINDAQELVGIVTHRDILKWIYK